ncbi:MAG: hypothetical protein M3Z31_01815 [Pseudomonadota bacterium]|nr:hypothetical protein [Pseudomonadota bacterium]
MATRDPVRAYSSPAVNERLDRETLQRLRRHADRSPDSIAQQLERLDSEWDIHRVLQVNAAAIGLTGLALAMVRHRRWLIVPGLLLSVLGWHALHRGSPPVQLLRRLGVRTQREIERERYALKGVRGDFEGATGHSQAAWRAVRS